MKLLRIILLTSLTTLTILTIQLSAKANKLQKVDQQVQDFLSSEITDIIINAKVVKSYQVEGHKSPKGNLHGYKVLKKGKNLNERQLNRLVEQLSSKDTYNFNTVKKCVFTPSFALRFFHDRKVVDVLICLSCSEIKFFYKDQERLEDVDNIKNTLRLLSYRLFR